MGSACSVLCFLAEYEVDHFAKVPFIEELRLVIHGAVRVSFLFGLGLQFQALLVAGGVFMLMSPTDTFKCVPLH